MSMEEATAFLSKSNPTPIASLRFLPSFIVLSSAASLLVTTTAGGTRSVCIITGAVAAAFWVVSFLHREKAWGYRAVSSFFAAGTLGALITARPDWTAVLGAVLPIFFSILLFGAPVATNMGPGWTSFSTRSAPARPAGIQRHNRTFAAIDAYLLLAEATMYQFIAPDAKLYTISLLLSVISVITIFSAAIGEGIDETRKVIRLIGIMAQVQLSAHDADLPAIRIVCGIVSGIYSIPALV